MCGPVSVLCVACFSVFGVCLSVVCGLFQCSLKELPELVELYLAGNPVTLEDGECPTYHTDIQTVLPALEIVDGVSRSLTPGLHSVSQSLSQTGIHFFSFQKNKSLLPHVLIKQKCTWDDP